MALVLHDLNTPTAVANAALAFVDHRGQMADLDAATGKHAELCRQFYRVALDEVTESYEWSFAASWHEYPTPLPGVSAPQPYPNGFALPAACLAVRALYPLGAPHLPEHCLGYDKRGNNIYLAQSAIEMVYTARLLNLAPCTAHFVHAVAYKMAYHIALPVAQSADAKGLAMQAYREAHAQARQHDIRSGGVSAFDFKRPGPSNIAARYG